MSGGALETVYLRRLISAHVSPQPRLMRAVVRHNDGSSRYGRQVVHAPLSTRGWALLSSQDLTKFVEQRFCLFKIGRVEAFGEPAINRGEKIAGCGALALVLPQAREPGGGA